MKGSIVPFYTSLSAWGDTDPRRVSLKNLADSYFNYPNTPLTVVIGTGVMPVTYNSGTNTAINYLQGKGVKVIHYVYTSWGSPSVSTINGWVDSAIAAYPQLDGIYFDEWDTATFGLAGYQQVAEHARTKTDFIVANAHGRPASWYVLPNSPDVLIVTESPGTTPALVNASIYNNYLISADYGSERRAYQIHSIDSGNFTDNDVVDTLKYVDWIYITENHVSIVSPHTYTCWETVSGWIDRQLQILESVNKKRIKLSSITKDFQTILTTIPPTNSEQVRLKTDGYIIGLQTATKTDDWRGNVRIKSSTGVNSIKKL